MISYNLRVCTHTHVCSSIDPCGRTHTYIKYVYVSYTEFGTLLATWSDHTDVVQGLAYSPNGMQLASCAVAIDSVWLWNVETGTVTSYLNGIHGSCNDVDWSPDGQFVAAATGSGTNQVLVWDVLTGDVVATISGVPGSYFAVDFSPDSTMLATGAEKDKAQIYDTATWALVSTFNDDANGPGVGTVEFSPDGATLAARGKYGGQTCLNLWNVNDGSVVRLYFSTWPDYEVIRILAWSPDGTKILTGSMYHSGSLGPTKLWDVATASLEMEFVGLTNTIKALAFSGDGSVVAAGDCDCVIKLWDFASGAELATLTVDDSCTTEILEVAFNPDSSVLAAAYADSNMRFWAVGSAGKPLSCATLYYTKS